MDDFQSCFHFCCLSGLSRSTLPHDILEQQAVLADSLHRLEQVRPQVHLVAKVQLLLLVRGKWKSRRMGLVCCDQDVRMKLGNTSSAGLHMDHSLPVNQL